VGAKRPGGTSVISIGSWRIEMTFVVGEPL
jgi:hypothetical protein